MLPCTFVFYLFASAGHRSVERIQAAGLAAAAERGSEHLSRLAEKAEPPAWQTPRSASRNNLEKELQPESEVAFINQAAARVNTRDLRVPVQALDSPI